MEEKDSSQPAELSDKSKKSILEWVVYLGKALLEAILLKLGFKKVQNKRNDDEKQEAK